ncbi:RNA-directed DNA polymerase, eukaryota [Tanacetum coccineum]
MDRWTCDLSGDGEFKVKVIRNFIDDLFLPSSDVATRWVKFIPIKVNVFSWRARRDRLPTRVNLSRRGVLLDSHLCPLCNAAMEDVQHVFFRCDVARVVLRKICRWWDLDWQEICSFSDWDAWFLSFRLSSRLKSILEGLSVEDSESKLMKETSYELLEDDQKKKLGKNNESKTTLYNALPRKEYERVFMHPDYSSKTHVRKFLRAIPLKWKSKVTAIEEDKDLVTLPLDELVGNLKVYEMILENDGVVSKTTTKDKVKSLALKDKVTRKQTSDNST